jgi:L-seryl-tRNA(Ser) seleniumtransferase
VHVSKQMLFAQIPQVDKILRHQHIKQLEKKFPRRLIVEALRDELANQRKKIQSLETEDLATFNFETDGFIRRICSVIEKKLRPRMCRIVNAGGIILNTGLGRAPLSKAAKEALAEVAEGFSPLEIDLESGKRGDRHTLVEDLLIKLTGAEAAMVVNNNAAAVFLALNTLAFEKEITVSRGELIAIGGSFRIPEIIKKSGAKMVEVGTTNQTFIDDYKSAINENTALLLRVHTSNYKIIGFTAQVALTDLVRLAHENDLPLVDDLGSGMLIDLSKYGLPKEPVVSESIKAGADVVTFSGDKLLGGPQAGIIIGRKKYIDVMKKNQLTRTLRCCKLTFAALEATLRLFFDEDRLLENHQVLNCLTTSMKRVNTKANDLYSKIKKSQNGNIDAGIIDGFSEVGGGSLATESLPTKLVYVRLKDMADDQMALLLRQNNPPVIVRVQNEQVVIDARTIGDDEIDIIANAITKIAQEFNHKES